jgi:hypothetical protein
VSSTPAPSLAEIESEIERREARYETWLEQQGLERVGETPEATSTDPPSDSPY